jgi:hypothetical protein
MIMYETLRMCNAVVYLQHTPSGSVENASGVEHPREIYLSSTLLEMQFQGPHKSSFTHALPNTPTHGTRFACHVLHIQTRLLNFRFVPRTRYQF